MALKLEVPDHANERVNNKLYNLYNWTQCSSYSGLTKTVACSCTPPPSWQGCDLRSGARCPGLLVITAGLSVWDFLLPAVGLRLLRHALPSNSAQATNAIKATLCLSPKTTPDPELRWMSHLLAKHCTYYSPICHHRSAIDRLLNDGCTL